ncbi:MAG: PQQ-like beta-propeller repeat protein [Phycisphaerales bacterium]|nr:PQQ-like beta-propeller repeat protein [Phycisphaerales bacterium]
MRTMLLLTIVSTLAYGDDWPAWRGADGSGVSTEAGWSSTGSQLWTATVGIGYSSFVTSGDRVVTVGHDVEAKLDTVTCFEATTGEVRWTYSFAVERHNKMHGGGSLSTPVIDGDLLYGLSREGLVYCLSMKDGAEVWTTTPREAYDLKYPEWMFAASPLIVGDTIYLNMGRTLALDKETGAVRWASESNGDAYSTPQPIRFGETDALAVFNSAGLSLIDASDGAVLDFHEWKTMYDINAATPIVIGDRIFISSGQNRGCAMFQVQDGHLQVLWENKRMSNKMTGCVLYDGHLYGFDGTQLKCLDLDGEEHWVKRGFGMGTLMIADGRLIVMTSKGELAIAEATPREYVELSRTRVLEGGVYWTMPVLSDGLIYCRNSEGEVVCMDHR